MEVLKEATVYLVHGTFANGISCYAEESKLRDAIAKRLHGLEVEFRPIVWQSDRLTVVLAYVGFLAAIGLLSTGALLTHSDWFGTLDYVVRGVCAGYAVGIAAFAFAMAFSTSRLNNSWRSRSSASKKLADTIESLKRQEPRRLQFAVCHSHGGNVVLYADMLARDKLNVKTPVLDGVITLGTPFIHTRLRDLPPNIASKPQDRIVLFLRKASILFQQLMIGIPGGIVMFTCLIVPVRTALEARAINVDVTVILGICLVLSAFLYWAYRRVLVLIERRMMSRPPVYASALPPMLVMGAMRDEVLVWFMVQGILRALVIAILSVTAVDFFSMDWPSQFVDKQGADGLLFALALFSISVGLMSIALIYSERFLRAIQVGYGGGSHAYFFNCYAARTPAKDIDVEIVRRNGLVHHSGFDDEEHVVERIGDWLGARAKP